MSKALKEDDTYRHRHTNNMYLLEQTWDDGYVQRVASKTREEMRKHRRWCERVMRTPEPAIIAIGQIRDNRAASSRITEFTGDQHDRFQMARYYQNQSVARIRCSTRRTPPHIYDTMTATIITILQIYPTICFKLYRKTVPGREQ